MKTKRPKSSSSVSRQNSSHSLAHKPLLTAVVPCYNEELSLPLFYNAVVQVATELADQVEFEFLFINDGSRDRTTQILADLAQQDSRIKYLTFSRNFGKEAAIFAGLEHATGDFVAVLDADLQHPPSMLPTMLAILQTEDYQSVNLRRVNRKGEPLLRSFFSRQFHKIINRLANIQMVDGAVDYRLMTRPVVDAVVSCREYNRYTKGLYSFVGFKTKWLEYENIERVAGETKWSFCSLFAYAIEGFVSFSTAPLVFAAILGVILCAIAIIAAIFIVVRTILFGDPVAGWPTLACLILLTSGAQLFCIGIVGEYLAKTYLEVKHRPIYIIDQRNSHGFSA